MGGTNVRHSSVGVSSWYADTMQTQVQVEDIVTDLMVESLEPVTTTVSSYWRQSTEPV